ncbi:MAG: GNAT family N-acetyltransferase [Bryobacteraceae bacterium]|nr:GNAT family N-acetyltransferase [Bryobacteraceae bacterium]
MEDFELVDRNLRLSMECYAQATGFGEIRRIPGVTMACAGTESAVFNVALLTEPVPPEPVELDRRIMIAKVFFAARGLRWSFWVCQDLLDPSLRRRASEIFSRRRLRYSSACPGMLAERIEPPVRPLPPVEFRRVSDAATRLSFCQITSQTFGLAFDTATQVYNVERAWETDLVGYVGYVEGKAVTTAATVSGDGVVGVYSVATLPEYRGRGIAEKTVRYALDKAMQAAGIERSVLQSSREGHSLYLRMGYRKVTDFHIYFAQ